MELDFLSGINWINIAIDLVMIIITTGVTYVLFSVLPARKRKNILKRKLVDLKSEIDETFIAPTKEYGDSYKLHANESHDPDNCFDPIQSEGSVEILRWNAFKMFYTTHANVPIFFQRQWQGNEIIKILNSMIMDNEIYMDISMLLSELFQKIDHTRFIIKDDEIDLFFMKKPTDFLPSDGDHSLVYLALRSMEETYEVALKLSERLEKVT